MNTSKAAIAINSFVGKLLSIFGYVTGIFFLIIICVGLTDLKSEGAVEALVFSFIMLALSVWAVLKGRQIKLRIKRFKAYVGLISVEHITSIENLAGSTNKSVDFVKEDLKKMIDKKFFSNAHIDSRTNEIIIGNSSPSAQSTGIADKPTSQTAAAADSENVKCLGCGAVNTKQRGAAIHCEYCGTVIQ